MIASALSTALSSTSCSHITRPLRVDIAPSSIETIPKAICFARYVVDLAEKFNRFYKDHRIVVDDERVRNARLHLTDCVAKTIKTGLGLLGISAPEVM